MRKNIITECNRILGLCSGTETKDARSIRQLCDGFLIYIAEQAIEQQLSLLSEHYPNITATGIKTTLEGIKDVAREGIRNEGLQYEVYTAIDVNKRRRIEESIKPLLGRYRDSQKIAPHLAPRRQIARGSLVDEFPTGILIMP